MNNHEDITKKEEGWMSRKQAWILFAVLFAILVGVLWYLYAQKQQALVTQENFVQLDPTFIEKTQKNIAQLKQLIEENPNDNNLWRTLGTEYYALGEYANAQEALYKAVELNTFDYLAYANLGDVQRAMGDLVVAEESYKKAIARDPYYTPSYVSLAELYLSQNETAKAEEAYQAGIDVTSDSFLMKKYAVLLEELARYSDAISYWKLAQEKEPENALIADEIKRLEALAGVTGTE